MNNSSLNNPVHGRLIESYHNGYSWYRLYSDGWIEQGGRVKMSGSSPTSASVTFLKPFAANDYFVVANYIDTSKDQYGQCYNLTKTSFVTKGYGGYYNCWLACGYIA